MATEKRKDIESILEKLEVDLVKTNILPPSMFPIPGTRPLVDMEPSPQ